MIKDFLKLIEGFIEAQAFDLEKLLNYFAKPEIKEALQKYDGVSLSHILVNLRVYANRLSKDISQEHEMYLEHNLNLTRLRESIFKMLEGIIVASKALQIDEITDVVRISEFKSETKYLSLALKEQIANSINDLMNSIMQSLSSNALANILYLYQSSESNATLIEYIYSEFYKKNALPSRKELNSHLQRISFDYEEDNGAYGSKELKEIYSILTSLIAYRDIFKREFLYFDYRVYLKLFLQIPINPSDAVEEIVEFSNFCIQKWVDKFPCTKLAVELSETQEVWIPPKLTNSKYIYAAWTHNTGIHVTGLLQDKLKGLQQNWERISSMQSDFNSEKVYESKIHKAIAFNQELSRHNSKTIEIANFINSALVYKFFNARVFKENRQRLSDFYGKIGIRVDEIYFYLNRLIHHYFHSHIDEQSILEKYGFIHPEKFALVSASDGKYEQLVSFVEKNDIKSVIRLINFAIERHMNHIIHAPDLRRLLINFRDYFSKNAHFLHYCAKANNHYLAAQFLSMGYESRRDVKNEYPEYIAFKNHALECLSVLIKGRLSRSAQKTGSILDDERLFDALCSKEFAYRFITIIADDQFISQQSVSMIFNAVKKSQDFILLYAVKVYQAEAFSQWLINNYRDFITSVILSSLDEDMKLKFIEIVLETEQQKDFKLDTGFLFNVALKFQAKWLFEYLLQKNLIDFDARDEFGQLPLIYIISFMTKGQTEYLKTVVNCVKVKWDHVFNIHGQTPIKYLELQLGSKIFHISEDVKTTLQMNPETNIVLEKVLKLKENSQSITSSSSRDYHPF